MVGVHVAEVCDASVGSVWRVEQMDQNDGRADQCRVPH